MLSLAVLPVLIVLNFYGLYSNKFYWLKVDNFIFPLVTILHYIYLSSLHFRIREAEMADLQLRNLEAVEPDGESRTLAHCACPVLETALLIER